MLSFIFDGGSLKDIKRTSFNDLNGLVLEAGDTSVFITYEVADRIVAFQKEAYVFVSQIESERMISELKPFVENSTVVTVFDKSFLLRCLSDYRKHIDFTASQKKSLKVLYLKYVGESKKIEDDNIPF